MRGLGVGGGWGEVKCRILGSWKEGGREKRASLIHIDLIMQMCR